MDNLADRLTPSVGRPVTDHTSMAGSFSFHANLFNLEKTDELKSAMVSNDAADTLRATLPEQLGLQLEAQKAPIVILVIDHAEKVPTEN
jgi:uncharacterized protein (TIGR03435 family)